MNAPIIIRGRPHQFIEHSGFADCATRLDQFAEYLAEGHTPAQASRYVYGTATNGNAMLQRIRKRLGPQAR